MTTPPQSNLPELSGSYFSVLFSHHPKGIVPKTWTSFLLSSQRQKNGNLKMLFLLKMSPMHKICQLDKLITENRPLVQTYSRRMLWLMFLVTCSTSPSRSTAAPIAKKYLYPTILMTIESSFVSLKHIKNQTLVA